MKVNDVVWDLKLRLLDKTTSVSQSTDKKVKDSFDFDHCQHYCQINTGRRWASKNHTAMQSFFFTFSLLHSDADKVRDLGVCLNDCFRKIFGRI